MWLILSKYLETVFKNIRFVTSVQLLGIDTVFLSVCMSVCMYICMYGLSFTPCCFVCVLDSSMLSLTVFYFNIVTFYNSASFFPLNFTVFHLSLAISGIYIIYFIYIYLNTLHTLESQHVLYFKKKP